MNHNDFKEYKPSVPGEPYITALDINIIRLADVILMAAECAVAENDLTAALNYVNSIRQRAANLAPRMIGNEKAADYDVKPYPSFPDKEYALKAVRMERRLELALEGHRFFDLVRWGVAKETIESYSTYEGGYLPSYSGIIFNPHNAYFPIPQSQIDRSGGTLEQNDGYK